METTFYKRAATGAGVLPLLIDFLTLDHQLLNFWLHTAMALQVVVVPEMGTAKMVIERGGVFLYCEIRCIGRNKEGAAYGRGWVDPLRRGAGGLH